MINSVNKPREYGAFRKPAAEIGGKNENRNVRRELQSHT